MVGGPDVTGTIINASDNVIRRANTASYVVWFDGTLYHADSMTGGADVTPGTDAATVINAALTAISQGSVFIRNVGNVYTINSPILINNDNVSLVSDYAQLIQGNSLNIDMVQVAAGQKDVTVEGLDLNGNAAQNPSTTQGRPIHVLGTGSLKSTRITITRNKVHDFSNQGIRLQTNSIDCQVTDNYVYNGGVDGILAMFGVHLRLIMARNTVDTCQYGISSSRNQGVIIADNQIYNSTWTSIMYDGSSVNGLIDNNFIWGGTRNGINIRPSGDSDAPRYFKVSNNLIYNMGDNGIYILNAGYGIFIDNIIYNCGANSPGNRHGIFCDTPEGQSATAGVKNCIFTENIITGANQGYGINFANAAHTPNIVRNNDLRGNLTNGLNLVPTTGILHHNNQGYNPTPSANGSVIQATLKAGAPVDGDFTNPQDGLVVVDSTNNKIWTRIGGTWKGVAVA